MDFQRSRVEKSGATVGWRVKRAGHSEQCAERRSHRHWKPLHWLVPSSWNGQNKPGVTCALRVGGEAGLAGEGRTREVMVGDQDRKEVGSCSEGPENPEKKSSFGGQ